LEVFVVLARKNGLAASTAKETKQRDISLVRIASLRRPATKPGEKGGLAPIVFLLV
jgi:hypothetical protein